MKDELRAITKNQRNLDSAVMMSSLMPSEKCSCSGSSLMLAKASTAIAGRSGEGNDDGHRLQALARRSGGLRRPSPLAGFRTSPTNRMPLRAMVRISFCSAPLSPTALRAALMRLVKGQIRHDPAAPDRGEQIVLADDALAVLQQIGQDTSNTCGSTAIGLSPRRSSRVSVLSVWSAKRNCTRCSRVQRHGGNPGVPPNMS